MRVLVACEFSGVVREAFRSRGHKAWSCDLLPAEDANLHHIKGDVLSILDLKWDLMIAHPPCTYLGVSGFHWCYHYPKKPKPGILYGPERLKAAEEATEFVRKLMAAKIPKIAIENPVSVISSAFVLRIRLFNPGTTDIRSSKPHASGVRTFRS